MEKKCISIMVCVNSDTPSVDIEEEEKKKENKRF